MVPAEINHKKLNALFQFWDQKNAASRIPAPSAFRPEDFKPWMGHLMIVEPEGMPPRFRVRLHGTRLYEYDGQDLTGWYLDDVVPRLSRQKIVAPYNAAVLTGHPQYDVIRSPFETGTVRRLSRLVLPLATDGKTVDRLLVAMYLELTEATHVERMRAASISKAKPSAFSITEPEL